MRGFSEGLFYQPNILFKKPKTIMETCQNNTLYVSNAKPSKYKVQVLTTATQCLVEIYIFTLQRVCGTLRTLVSKMTGYRLDDLGPITKVKYSVMLPGI
jgi:hypothetical protein